jgi:pimeloyl-ACP methyl ester carboxylesterase
MTTHSIAVVVLHHSAPGSRRFDPDPAATAAAGVRLVTIDRAGYGGSDPLPAGTVPTIPGYAADAAAVLDHLGVTSAVVAGWSAGGRVAAALAAARPELVASLFLIGTPAPHEDVPWIPSEHEPAIAAMRADPTRAVEVMADALSSAPADGDDDGTALLAGGPADAAALEADPDLRRRVTAMLAEGLRTGPIGVAADIVSYTVADWGFDPASIGASTTGIYGADDLLVPPAHGEWWTTRIPSAALDVVDDAGHLVVVPAWPRVIAAARPA